MVGNDDFLSNNEIINKNKAKGNYVFLNDEVIFANSDISMIGYSFVPLTPFVFKDHEKLDLDDENETITRKKILLDGIITFSKSQKKVSFDVNDRKDTIEKDMNNLFKKAEGKKIILISHTPPYNTALDMIDNKEHIGSRAIRKIIEKKQPILCLSGHIHETVDISGKYFDYIGKTLCLSSGNSNLGEDLKTIIIEINETIRHDRKIL